MSFFFGTNKHKSNSREELLLSSSVSNNRDRDMLLLSSLSKKINKPPPIQNLFFIPESIKPEFLETSKTSFLETPTASSKTDFIDIITIHPGTNFLDTIAPPSKTNFLETIAPYSETNFSDNIAASSETNFLHDIAESSETNFSDSIAESSETNFLETITISPETNFLDTITTPFLKNNYTETKIYIISNIASGGTNKYVQDLIKNYTMAKIVRIYKKSELVEINNYSPLDILLVQQLLYTDIFAEDLININKNFGSKIILCLHDFCWFNESTEHYNNSYHNSYLKELKEIKIEKNNKTLFDYSSLIICNSNFTKNVYSFIFSDKGMILEENNDIAVDYTTKRVFEIKDNIINIANLQEFTECKGRENIELLMNKYNDYKGYKINFLIIGHNSPNYGEATWNEYIEHFNIHGLLHLNKWGETYSYALTKSINSGLPILYNNIGSFRSRIPKDVEHYIKVVDYEQYYYDNEILFNKFEEFLDYIIKNNGLFNKFNNNNNIVYKDSYEYIFQDTRVCKKINDQIFNKVKPFAVYFPQFHSILENDTNYYKGMTDITNLEYFNKTAERKLDQPSLQELGIKTILDYDLTNKSIINRQIEIAKKYSLYGFACYYYWFSTNSITNKHDVMEKCYNLFFEEPIDDFKIFFIWANEDWSNNPAFNAKQQILNEYSSSNLEKNIENLIKYFKHDNYYKVDNKPVFYIHHPFFMTKEELLLFKTLLENACIENGFNGSILVINNFLESYKDFNNYSFHPNYKKTDTRNYNEYIDNHLKNECNVNTAFFDFNNSARFCKPNKLEFVSFYKNNSIYVQDKYLKKVLQQYKNSNTEEFNKTLLINSWNEWGENMAIEPGEVNGYKYLLLLKSNLMSFIADSL